MYWLINNIKEGYIKFFLFNQIGKRLSQNIYYEKIFKEVVFVRYKDWCLFIRYNLDIKKFRILQDCVFEDEIL